MKFVNILIVGALLLGACGPARHVVPLEHKENAVSASFGGPLVDVPGVTTLPLPFTSVGYARGLTPNITVAGNWYSTSALFGVAQFDAGASIRMLESVNHRHGFSTYIGSNLAVDAVESTTKLWPQLDMHYYWRYNRKEQVQSDMFNKSNRPVPNLIYAGIGSWWELSGTKAHGQDQKDFVVPMLNIGHNLNWKRWSFKTELKLIAPFSTNNKLVVDYKSVMGDRGATGVFLGLTRTF